MLLKSFVCACVATVAFGSVAQAATIRVSQESSQGAGDFDANIVGSIQSFSTTDSVATFYSFGDPVGWSYNNNTPSDVSDTTQYFFVDAADGLAFVTVHDAVNDGTAGRINTAYTFKNGVLNDTQYAVLDDKGGNDVYTETDIGGDRSFSTSHIWSACCTDGVAFNSLGFDFTIFADVTFSQGMGSMIALSDGGSALTLNGLATDGRVRFDYVLPTVTTNVSVMPVPPAGLLLLGGLCAFGAIRARSKRSA